MWWLPLSCLTQVENVLKMHKKIIFFLIKMSWAGLSFGQDCWYFFLGGPDRMNWFFDNFFCGFLWEKKLSGFVFAWFVTVWRSITSYSRIIWSDKWWKSPLQLITLHSRLFRCCIDFFPFFSPSTFFPMILFLITLQFPC